MHLEGMVVLHGQHEWNLNQHKGIEPAETYIYKRVCTYLLFSFLLFVCVYVCQEAFPFPFSLSHFTMNQRHFLERSQHGSIHSDQFPNPSQCKRTAPPYTLLVMVTYLC